MRQSACSPPDDTLDSQPAHGPSRRRTRPRLPGLGELAIALAVTALGCPPPEADERPDRTDLGDGGGGSPVTTIGGGSGGTVGAAGSSTATGGSLSDWATTTLVAEAHEIYAFNTLPTYPSDPIVNSRPYSGQVTVVAQGRNEEAFVPAEAVEETFEIDDVRRAEDTWVRVSADEAGIVDMLHQVDTADGDSDTVYVMDREVMNGILRNGASGAYENNRAQVIVRIIDENRDGVAGIRVELSGGDDVLFQDQGQWSTTPEVTDASGLALVMNLEAEAKDGSTDPVIIDGVTFDIPVYPGTVTLVEIAAP